MVYDIFDKALLEPHFADLYADMCALIAEEDDVYSNRIVKVSLNQRDGKWYYENGNPDDTKALRPYESDGLTAYKTLPLIVVLPETKDQVSQVMRYCHENAIKVVPRVISSFWASFFN